MQAHTSGSGNKIYLKKSELKPLAYWRYVDDVWGLWEHGETELKRFHELSNKLHPRIKTELRYSADKIEFLDVNVIIDHGNIKTDLYTKNTDKHQYLQATSSHPNAVKRAIPYGLGVRVKRICSEEDDYMKRREEIKMNLQKRGYKNTSIEEQLQKVDILDRKELLKYKLKTENNRVPLVLTFSKALPNIHSILRKHLKTLHQSDRLKKAFPDPPIVAFKRDKNIKDILVHKKHNLIFYKQQNVCRPCAKNCVLCSHVIESGTFKDNDGNEYTVQGLIDCKTVGVIYGINCTECNKLIYIGQTGDTLYQRMLLNFSKIRTRKTDDPIANHFTQHCHSAEDLKVFGIERVFGTETYRKVKEAFWIKKLKTLEPYGLNTQYER